MLDKKGGRIKNNGKTKKKYFKTNNLIMEQFMAELNIIKCIKYILVTCIPVLSLIRIQEVMIP